MTHNKSKIHFEKATLAHKDLIFSWLEEPHVHEFWDNSQEHRDDILNFMKGRKEPSSYFGGMNSYWIGVLDTHPYCFIMTNEETDTPESPECYRPHLSKTGRTYGLSFCIGNKAYLGKGFAAPTLESFMKFFVEQIDSQTDLFFIDPFLNNPRAIHVYKKAGFKIVSEFIQEGGYFDKSTGVLMVKNPIYGEEK